MTNATNRIYRCFIVCIIAIFAAGSAFAGDGFRVHDVSGDVTVLNDGEWIGIKKHIFLNPAATIKIGHNGLISLVDPRSKRLYTIKKEGQASVARIVTDSKKASESTITSVNRQLAAAIAKQGNTKQKAYGSAGVIFRGDNNEVDSMTVNVVQFIKNMLNSTDTIESSITMTRQMVNGITHFTVKNAGDVPLWFNGLIVDENGKPIGLCWPVNYDLDMPCLLIDSHSERELSDYQFLASDLVKHKIILFACTTPFDCTILQDLLLDESSHTIDIGESIPPCLVSSYVL